MVMTCQRVGCCGQKLSTTLCLPNLYKLVCQRICTRPSNVSTTWLSTICLSTNWPVFDIICEFRWCTHTGLVPHDFVIYNFYFSGSYATYVRPKPGKRITASWANAGLKWSEMLLTWFTCWWTKAMKFWNRTVSVQLVWAQTYTSYHARACGHIRG